MKKRTRKRATENEIKHQKMDKKTEEKEEKRKTIAISKSSTISW